MTSRVTLTNGHPDPEWLGARHDGELNPAEERQVDAHVAACAECRATLTEFATLSRMTPELEPELPGSAYWVGLTERIVQQVAAEAGAEETGAPASASAARHRAPLDALITAAAAPRALGRPSGVRSAWRWAMPLAAACGVALLSWRLLSSRPALVREIGDPGPGYRAGTTNSAPARPAPAKENADRAVASREDARSVGAAGALRSAPPAPGRGEAKKSAAAAPTPIAQSTGDEVGAAPPAATPATVESADGPHEEAGALRREKAQAFLSDARELPSSPTDSLLTAVTLQADSLWLQLGWPEQRAAAGARSGAAAADLAAPAPLLAAPPDSGLARRCLALTEERVSLLKTLHPEADRADLETRIARLRGFLKISPR